MATVRTICIVEDCNTPTRPGSNTHCETHYYRLRRTGTTDKAPTRMEWLTERLSQPFGDECVEWPFGKSDSYGMVKHNGKNRQVTHLSLESVGKPRPPAPKDHALHSCDNPPCFNPNHLSWDTKAENSKQAAERALSAHKISEDDVLAICVLSNLGHSGLDISKMFNLSTSHISNILSGKSRKYVSRESQIKPVSLVTAPWRNKNNL